MDQFYVTPDGQIAQLPRRSFLDRLTSGLYDASVEFRRPGGGQEARLARTQPLTSALNQYGQQQRGFTQEEKMLGKQQEFTAGQNTLNRDNQWAISDFEAGRAMERARLEREARAKEFEAVQGLREMERFDKIYEGNRKFATEMEMLPLQRQLTQSQIAENAAQAQAAEELAKYRLATSALEGQTVSPQAMAIAAALNKELAPFTNAPVGLTYGQLGTISRLRPGTSGAMPFDLFGGGGQINTTPSGTNALPVLNLNKRPQ